MLIEKIPRINVPTDSGFGWDTIAASIAGAIFAVAIPAFIAWWSIKNNNKTLREDRAEQLKDFEKGRTIQLNIAEESRKAQIIASNRLVWIKDLREASAEFVSSAYHNLSLSQKHVIVSKSMKSQGMSEQKIMEFELILNETRKESRASFVQLVLHMARIQMMLNPERPEHRKVIAAMNGLKLNFGNIIKKESDLDGEEANQHLNEFVSDMQHLLKEEWEKVKRNI